MPPFRGSDDCLDREIETLESIARLRVRRVTRELQDLDRELRELRRERARRRATIGVPTASSEPSSVES